TNLIASVTGSSSTFNWTDVAAGSYVLTAKATDNSGAATTSAPVNITVNSGVAQLYFIHTDHLNTPRLIANQAAQTVWRWDNTEPFGNTVPNENPSGLGMFTCNLRFPGQYFDKETNLHYNYFRDYDPTIGRYIQSDPVGLRGGVNIYAYVGSSPLRWEDPFGLASPGSGFDTRYGNWCGQNWSGGRQGPIIPQNPAGPIDSLDECCMAHDYCYATFKCDSCPSGSRAKEGKKECDKVLVSCLSELKGKPPQAWPKPPRPGTETGAYFFCQKALRYFE
ncbi:MAG TPA: RHS repeat-associated core domain-containing protein, partial [Burkholderiales bacterium]|nr:RHS repeat-associated core domain-containing protein [Burkholderiales bacterium]